MVAMLKILATAVILLGMAISSAYADYRTPFADLVCDPANNVALARFDQTLDDKPPDYKRLPATLDRALSAQPGTGRRVCKLANGWEIKLRNGIDQAFGYGMGGGAPPAFFSLWVDHHKVFSQKVWSEQDYSQSHVPIIGVVVTPKSLSVCKRKSNPAELPVCTAEAFDPRKSPADRVEYPAHPGPPPRPGSLLITGGTFAPGVCKKFIPHGKPSSGKWDRYVTDSRGEPDIKIPAEQWEWINTKELRRSNRDWTALGDLGKIFGISEDRFHVIAFPTWPLDFDGDKQNDTVIKRKSLNHYFDGDYYVVAPGNVPVRDVLDTLYGNNRDEDVENDIKRAEAMGWHVYGGGRPGFYPGESPRYVHIENIRYLGQTLLLASPTNQDIDPTHILIRPKPDGSSETARVFQRPRLNY